MEFILNLKPFFLQLDEHSMNNAEKKATNFLWETPSFFFREGTINYFHTSEWGQFSQGVTSFS